MQVRWLKQSADASGIIVIFGGWAIGSGVLSHLEGDQDLLFVDDYRTLDSDLPDLSAYSQRTAVAWSFGVAAFAHWLAGRPDIFNRKVAITGSLSPVDRRLGIPPVVFERTVQGLTEESYQGFLALCFGETQPRQDIDVDARRAELERHGNAHTNKHVAWKEDHPTKSNKKIVAQITVLDRASGRLSQPDHASHGTVIPCLRACKVQPAHAGQHGA